MIKMLTAARQVAASVVVATMILIPGLALAPNALADSVSHHEAARPGAGWNGQVLISTEARGIIKVQILGRRIGTNPTGLDGLCVVHVRGDGRALEGRVRLNGGGNGELRFGELPNGTYQVNGDCYDGWLTYPTDTTVVIDGAGPATVSPIPVPQFGNTESLDQYCNRMVDDVNAVALASVFVSAGAGIVIAGAAAAASAFIRGTCMNAAQSLHDGQTFADQFCRQTEDGIHGIVDAVAKGLPVSVFIPSICQA
ncbi:hypothetical protein ACFYO1_34665 [Nocardia sp. NPDC006044]|uniref:hypothetical protein n=1 Tax=Nocardia sp. NPDC006044 TaxID=3364306 RepID=UPI0036826D1D